MTTLKNLPNLWIEFWFSAKSNEPMRAFRIVFGAVLFIFYSSRTFDLDLFYSNNGILQLSQLSEIIPRNYRYSLLYVFTNTWSLYFLHGLFLLSLLSLVVGYFSRLSAIVAFVLHVSFMHRNMGPVYGVDLISTFFLFFLCFADTRAHTQTGARGQFSLRSSSVSSSLSSMAYRLAQVQVCIIYAYSGLEKLRGAKWWQGEAIWDVLSNFQFARWDFTWTASVPILIVIATYTTLVWEVYFPVLVWIKPIRKSVLLMGVLLHLGIGLAINLVFFGAVMISTYCLFLDAGDLKKIKYSVQNLFRFFLSRLQSDR